MSPHSIIYSSHYVLPCLKSLASLFMARESPFGAARGAPPFRCLAADFARLATAVQKGPQSGSAFPLRRADLPNDALESPGGYGAPRPELSSFIRFMHCDQCNTFMRHQRIMRWKYRRIPLIPRKCFRRVRVQWNGQFIYEGSAPFGAAPSRAVPTPLTTFRPNGLHTHILALPVATLVDRLDGSTAARNCLWKRECKQHAEVSKR